LDTANYEHPGVAKFEYKLQWAKDEAFKKAGIMGLLGSGLTRCDQCILCVCAKTLF